MRYIPSNFEESPQHIIHYMLIKETAVIIFTLSYGCASANNKWKNAHVCGTIKFACNLHISGVCNVAFFFYLYVY